MIGTISLVIASAVGGGHVDDFCFQQRVQPTRIVRQRILQFIPESFETFYFVGAPIRVRSLVEYEKRSDPDYQAFLEFKAYKAGAVGNPQARNAESGTDTLGAGETEYRATAADSYVTALCAKCHGKADPAADFYLSGREQVSAATITTAIRCIASGDMPKNHRLTREEKNHLLSELLDLEQETPTPTPVPSPPEPELKNEEPK